MKSYVHIPNDIGLGMQSMNLGYENDYPSDELSGDMGFDETEDFSFWPVYHEEGLDFHIILQQCQKYYLYIFMVVKISAMFY